VPLEQFDVLLLGHKWTLADRTLKIVSTLGKRDFLSQLAQTGTLACGSGYTILCMAVEALILDGTGVIHWDLDLSTAYPQKYSAISE
jgi:hypothetical protein